VKAGRNGEIMGPRRGDQNNALDFRTGGGRGGPKKSLSGKGANWGVWEDYSLEKKLSRGVRRKEISFFLTYRRGRGKTDSKPENRRGRGEWEGGNQSDDFLYTW